MTYLTPEQAQKEFGFHTKTLADWADTGKIRSFRTPGGHRRYYREDFIPLSDNPTKTTITVLYARVSTHSQKEDLLTQANYLTEHHEGEILREIGSGMNFKRKKFIKLMERVSRGEIGTIVVVHKDRLCRFGFDFVEWFCELHKCEIKVLGKTELSPHAELMQDFMAIMHCFSSRLYFLRRYKKEIEEAPCDQDYEENSDKPLDISECNGVSL
jgi:putative resolvase